MSSSDAKKALFVAEWENRTDRKMKSLDRLKQIDEVQARHNQTLEERRGRLARLYATEQEEYERALRGMVETMDQRRERMASKALELRTKREEKRQAVAHEKMEQAFQAGCDVLREQLSKQATWQTAQDRKTQVEVNNQRKMREAEEYRFFVEMEELERMRKLERAKEDLMRIHKLNAQLKQNLDTQMDAYNAAKEDAKQLKDEEDRLYKEQVQLQLEIDARKERERRANRVVLAKSNREFNDLLRHQKLTQLKLEKDEDVKLLEELIGRIKEEETNERSKKMQTRKAAQQFIESLRQQMGAEAENEAEIEKLWAMENDKQWAKREAQWKANQEARDVLLREVFEERALQLELKREMLAEQRANRQMEREKMLQEMEALTYIEKERAAQRRQLAINQRDVLKDQMDEKQAKKDNAKLEKLWERAAGDLAEEELQKRVLTHAVKLAQRQQIIMTR